MGMTCRLVGACARDLFRSFARGGIDIQTTRWRATWWIQGLLNVWARPVTTKVVSRVIAKARTKRNPAAWLNWAISQEGLPWLKDDELSAMVAGPRRVGPQPGTGMVSLSEALASLNFS